MGIGRKANTPIPCIGDTPSLQNISDSKCWRIFFLDVGMADNFLGEAELYPMKTGISPSLLTILPMLPPTPVPDQRRLNLSLQVLSGALLIGGLWLFSSDLNLQAMLWLNHLTPGFDDFWSFITQFGEGGAALLWLLVITRFSPCGTALSLKIFLLGSLLSPLLKSWFASPRPLGVIQAGVLNTIGQPPISANSMPSGHSLTVFAAVGVIFLSFQLKPRHWPAITLLALLAGLVALSRVMVGAHWPADVLTGAGAGLALAWVALQWESLQPWQPRLQTRNGQWCLLLTEAVLTVYLLTATTVTPAERLAFDLIATVGVAGAVSRWIFIRRHTWV